MSILLKAINSHIVRNKKRSRPIKPADEQAELIRNLRTKISNMNLLDVIPEESSSKIEPTRSPRQLVAIDDLKYKRDSVLAKIT